MVRLLPDAVLMTVAHAMALQALSLELDMTLVKACVELQFDPARLTDHEYAEAYRHCDNIPVRREQIELMGLVGRELEHWVHMPFVYQTLIICRVPARLAGLIELQHFLEEGFSAFRRMRGAEEFLTTIEQRESRILEEIFAGTDDPFDLD